MAKKTAKNTKNTAHNEQLEGTDSLGGYIANTLYSKWRNNRKELDEQWNKNISAFRSEDFDSPWKEGEAGNDGEDWRSKTCINIVRNKCMSSFAVVIDQLLQGGKIPYMLKAVHDPSMVQMPPEAIEQETLATKMNYDYMEEQIRLSKSEDELIKAVKIGSIYGEVYGKRYVHKTTRNFYEKDTDEKPLVMNKPFTKSGKVPKETTRTLKSLGIKAITPWDIFRDMETDNLREGFGIIHRTFTSPHKLRSKKGRAFYLDKYIDTVSDSAEKYPYLQNKYTANSEDTTTVTPARRLTINKLNTLEQLEYYGKAPKEFVEKFEKMVKSDGMEVGNIADEDGEQGELIEIMAVVINSYVVKYARTSPEDRPFYRVPWEVKIDSLGAIGIADNIMGLQTSLNGAIRAFEDNKKLAGNVILALKERLIASKIKSFRPGMRVQLAEECKSANEAIQQIKIDDVADGYLPLIAKFEQYADEMSLIPKISQGITQKDAQTAYEISVQAQSSGKYLGAIIKHYDKYWIEPYITDMYEQNMRDPDAPVPKSNYTIKALGFSSFQDRIVRLGKLQQFFALVIQYPQMLDMVNLEWLISEMAKAFDLDPDQLLLPLEQRNQRKKQADEMNQMMQQMQIKMQQLDLQMKEVEIQATQMKAEATMIKAKSGEAKVQVDAQEKEHGMMINEHSAKMAENQQAIDQQQSQQEMQMQAQQQAPQQGNPDMVQV